MIEKRIDNSHLGLKLVDTSTSFKENANILIAPVTHIPKSPTRFVKTQAIHPDQIHATYSSHWTNTQPTPARILSPNSVLTTINLVNTRRPDFIELGGSRQKRTSLHKDNDLSRKIETTSDGVLRKIQMLQARIRQLHMDKQIIVSELTEKVNKLQMENDRLTVIVHNFECKEKETSNGEFSEGSLEEMLSSQININLELREDNERLLQELKVETVKSAELEGKYSSIQREMQALIRDHEAKLTNCSYEKQELIQRQQTLKITNADLQERLIQMEECRLQREKAIEEMVQEKEKRILELEEEVYSISSATAQKQKQFEEELTAIKLEQTQKDEECEQLRMKNAELEKQECKKCKQLLHMVFRLNCQLNKK